MIAVSAWERSNAFYRDVLGAEIVARGPAFVYRFGSQYLSVHGPGFFVKDMSMALVARHPVEPATAICASSGPARLRTPSLTSSDTAGRSRTGPFDAVGPLGQAGRNLYFRDPDGSLLEFVAYG